MNDWLADRASEEDRTVKWMVGEQLACVLHLGDSALAYRLADQGHEVIVAGDEVTVRRHEHVGFVRSRGDRLPFVSSSFDSVVVPHLDESPLAISEYARVLRPDGLVATLAHHHDQSIPWLRRLRDIIGMRDIPDGGTSPLVSSGLFAEPEEITTGAWEQLDLDGLMRFARANRHPSVPDSALALVRDLFDEYGRQTGFLRLRHEVRCIRARVDKSQIETEAEPETVLLDFR